MAKRKLKLLNREPMWDYNADDVEWSFFSCINTYRTSVHPSSKKEKQWVSSYMKWKTYKKEDIEDAQRGSSFYMGLVAPACRICTQSDKDAPVQWQKAINKYISILIIEGKRKRSEKTSKSIEPKVVISIQERIQNQVNEYTESLNKEIDKFVEHIQDKSTFDIGDWLKTKKIKSTQSAMLATEFQPMLDELEEAYNKKCEQLNEAYDFLTRPQLKKFKNLIQNIIDICNQHSKLSKAVRRPRRKKSRTPGQIIKKLQYCENSDEYNISSIDPRKIIGASKVVVFNTKNKKLAIFEASPLVDGLSVKGTTVVGFDEKKSKEKTVRKPNEILKDCATGGIRLINNRYKSLTTKEKIPTGRLNKNCVILQALK